MTRPTGSVAFTDSFPVDVLIKSEPAIMHTWLILIKEELGEAWLNNNLFRIGASGLLIDIERQLFHYITGRYTASHELAMS
jgi:hypothetical protein